MKKIASPMELQAELVSLQEYIYSFTGKPDREVLASKLRDLAERVASDKTESKFKKGQKVTYKGKPATIVEVAGNGKVTIKAQGGAAVKTFSPDEAEKSLKTASSPDYY